MNSKSKSIMNVDSSDLPAHQLHALYQLHSDMTVNKTLVNMQLAATHIAFMVQQQTKEHVCCYKIAIVCFSYTRVDNHSTDHP